MFSKMKIQCIIWQAWGTELSLEGKGRLFTKDTQKLEMIEKYVHFWDYLTY